MSLLLILNIKRDCLLWKVAYENVVVQEVSPSKKFVRIFAVYC